MHTIKKIAFIALMIAIVLALAYWLFPGEVIAIKVETKAPLTVQQIITEVFGKDAPIAIKIATCESGLNPMAVNEYDRRLNGHRSVGLFQISEINGDLLNWQDPRANTMAAKAMFDKGGWRPWLNCSRLVLQQEQ